MKPNAPVVTYDRNGNRRATTLASGSMSADFGGTPQNLAFEKMEALMQEGSWFALKEMCEAETRRTPTWLTPSLMCAKTYRKLSEIDKAIERYDYVIEEAGGNADYADATREREEIRETFGK